MAENSKRIVVAIDGPAAAGKSTVAQRIADKLGFVYINSGAMYRAIALWALRLHIDPSEQYRVEQLANEADIEFSADNARVFLNSEDVTDAIRDSRISDAASKLSAFPGVRRALVKIQRRVAEKNNVVMEGRDIGSVVFPHAEVKIFLDAETPERARRRALEFEQQGHPADLAMVAADLKLRDERDRNRTEAPLVQAPDAEFLDTTNLTLDEVEDRVLRLVRARTSNGKGAIA